MKKNNKHYKQASALRMHRYIKIQEQAYRDAKSKSFAGRLVAAAGLFSGYLAFAAHSAMRVLLSSSASSFEALHSQNEDGLWSASYTQHVKFKRHVRLYTVGSSAGLIAGIVLSISIAQSIFPVQRVLAGPTLDVTSSADAGPGSLRRAIVDANNSPADQTPEIIIKLAGTPTITLASALPAINHSNVSIHVADNIDSLGAIVDGTALAPGTNCLALTQAAAGSSVGGLAFGGCPFAGVHVQGNDIRIGKNTAVKDRVFVFGTTSGIMVDATAARAVIENVRIGVKPDGTSGPLSGNGIIVNGDDATIGRVVIGNSNFGLEIRGSNASVTSGLFGVKSDGALIPNTLSGLNITMATGTQIIGTDGDIVVAGNGGSGIFIDQSESTTVANAYVGVKPGAGDLGNGANGIIVNSSNNTTIGKNVSGVAQPVVIGYNKGSGITINNGSQGTKISEVRIGTDLAGTADLGNSGPGILVQSFSGLAIGNQQHTTTVANNEANGIDIGNPTGGVLSVTNVSSYNNAGHGIKIVGTANVHDPLVSQNTIGSNGANGIHLESIHDGITIQDNVIKGVGTGIFLSDVLGCTVTGNTMQAYTKEGLAIDAGSQNCTVVDNNFGYNSIDQSVSGGQFGISISGASSNIIIGSSDLSGQNRFAGNSTFHLNIKGQSQRVSFLVNSFIDGFPEKLLQLESGSNTGGPGQPVISSVSNTSVQGTGGLQDGVVYFYLNGTWIASDSTILADGLWEITADVIGQDSFNFTVGDELAVISKSSNGNSSIFSTAWTYTEDEEEEEVIVTPPELQLTATLGEITASTVEIQVTSNRESTATVVYGIDSQNLASTLQSTVLQKSHNLKLTGLTPGTDYFYRVTVASDSDSAQTQILSFQTLGALDSELKVATATVNKRVVYDAKKNLNLEPDQPVAITLEELSKDRDVRFNIKKSKDEFVVKGDWKTSNNGEVSQEFKNLKRYIQYTAHAQVRNSKKNKEQSTFTKIATFTKTHKKPTLTSLIGEYTVAATTKNIQFGGILNGLSGKVELQNTLTGKITVGCKIQVGEEFCSMPFDPPAGSYRVLFSSLKDEFYSASDQRLLQLSPAVMMSTFTTDERSPDYNYRMTTSETVTLVGLGPKGSKGTIYLNDKKQGTVTWITDIGWQYELSFDGACSIGEDCKVDIYFTDDSNFPIHSIENYLIKRAHPVVDLLVSDVSGQYLQNTSKTITVTGGADNIYRVTVDDVLIVDSILEPVTGSVQGQDTFLLPTDTIGNHVLRIQAEDPRTNLKGKEVTTSYVVAASYKAPGVATGDSPEVSDTTTESDATPSSNPTTPTDTSSDNVNDSNPDSPTDTSSDNVNDSNPDSPVNANSGETAEPSSVPVSDLTDEVVVENGVGIITTEDTSEIPAQYLTIETDPEKRSVLKTSLDLSLRVFELSLSTISVSDTGEILSSPVEVNDAGESVIRISSEFGPGASSSAASHGVIELSGTVSPYALVYVTLRSDPVVQVTRADATGQWQISVPLDALPEGEHTAFLQSESQGVYSDEIQIARFVVIEEKHLSGSSWIIIINGAILGIILIIITTVQIQKRIYEHKHPEINLPQHQSHLDGEVIAKTVKNIEIGDEKPPQRRGPLDI
ncbi:MAG: hypothetical protein COW24_02225 [Candidatus Kerfeldbacteria bacterium CG15_BIG_FIL_POST_REV_8_21_14_020_45_12]|uniref:Right handed beta helix domain-containing protein n=1 Tax=Candidatus Kerfeldbacteria bacterium CG15_BIG_FIL_POST_REV_8_21_14_020_45_12 TaxID=2014247 RepID=A0A2M7H495_9BACT|nr:MAG: hypothetical protein COW24_02225 [Candidatus Kerfeldbacteria bacterium CG15_BIG_FIL_POST_REV_8_21_14_020_45_12]PJA93934.1 MAG: hypothetical protein CO132_00625 [Candidatus Kerfeldbacteria bacterium CG_4_9_14_3_um_filter_45_8]